jgi:hypothetical protein
VLPRLRSIDAPVVAVVGGSTGSGKSTLVNSLVSANVTRPGVLRPTTVAPVLVHHTSVARWFTDDRILPDLARVTGGRAAGPTEIELVAVTEVPAGLALIDAPDIDSVVDENRALAGQLLDAADLWIFVTTAVRYADAVPWTFLRSAARRGVAVALVLNRVPGGAGGELAAHLGQMLENEGLVGTPLFVLEEQALDEGRIPRAALRTMREWLGGLVADQTTRAALVRRTLHGTVHDIAQRVDAIAEAVTSQTEALAYLRRRVDENFAAMLAKLSDDVRDGTVMRGEVLARWQDLVGTGDLLRTLQSSIGRARDRISSALTGRPTPEARFQGAIESGVQTLVHARIAEAVERTAAEWASHPAGAVVVREHPADLRRPADDLPERTARMVRDWQGGLLDLLRAEGRARRTTARVLSYGINGVALVLMVAVFAQTGGLTGTEVAVAGGSSVAGQKLLEALLGDQAVRRLATVARADLDRRTAVLVDAEADRYRAALARVDLDPALVIRLTRSAARLRAEVDR